MRKRPLGFVLGCSVTVMPLALLGLAALGPAACIPDPHGDFEEYNERTGEFRTTGEAGAIDSAPPTTAVQGLYYAVCLSQLAAGRPDRVLRFYTETTFTPDPAGGTGKIELKLTPLKLGPGNTAPPQVSKAWVIGNTYTVAQTPTDTNGVYAANLGTVTIPGEANPISGREIIVENAALPGRFAKEKFCSQLRGNVVQPTQIELSGEANTCVYLPVKEGDPPPAIAREDIPQTCTLK